MNFKYMIFPPNIIAKNIRVLHLHVQFLNKKNFTVYKKKQKS